MNSAITAEETSAIKGDLHLRAQQRLQQEMAQEPELQQQDIARQLYELRLDRIETELLSEEFHRLRRNVPTNNLNYKRGLAEFGYLFLNRDGRICDIRLVASDQPARDESLWAKRSLGEFLPANRRKQFQDFLDKVFGADGGISCELPFTDEPVTEAEDGLNLPAYGLFKAVADDARQYCLVVIEDISERKQAENMERASHSVLDMLDMAIAASRNEIYMMDAQSHRFTFANPRALENLGYTMEELKELMPADIQTGISAEEMGEIDDYLFSHKNSVRKLGSLHKRKDGSLYPVEIYLQYFEQERGNSIVVIALDTSNQTAIEAQLKSIVESASAIIWAADTKLQVVFVSNQVEEILGYPPDHLAGHSLLDLIESDFFHPEDSALLIEGFSKVIKDGKKVTNLCHRAKQADGNWRWLSMNMTPHRALDGKVIQMFGVTHDIHGQKQAEEALIELNCELDKRVREEIRKNLEKDALLQRQSRLAGMGEMIGNIAHQWRQPINSLGLILCDLEDAALYGECDLSYIQTAVCKSKKIIQKMSTTIDDFRHFFRADKSVGVFSLKQVTDECLNLVDASMKSSKINVVVKCERDVEVTGYANEYSQAMLNILSNAKDAIASSKIRNGEIVIEIGEEGGYGSHSVTDNGGGIPPEVFPRLFEPHFTTKEYGTGIGLYMTLVTIEKNMKGRVKAENVTGGAKFSLYLPLAPIGSGHADH